MALSSNRILLVACMLLFISLTGCAKHAIQHGETVLLTYTCTSPIHGDAVVATNNASIDGDKSIRKANFYSRNASLAPAEVDAGQAAPKMNPQKLAIALRDEIVYQLAGQVEGRKEGLPFQTTLTAEANSTLPPNERFIQMSRIQTCPKQMWFPRSRYVQVFRKEPEVGETVPLDDNFQAEIAATEADRINLLIRPANENTFQNAFGRGIILDRSDHWEILIDSQEGRIVKSGPLLGVITKVDDDVITIDYGNPFAGLTLECRAVALVKERK